mmetsp:Transcript_6624/g.10625  ORF Transcript_6624/g.10625 Transcript_6624/m.10625 type:complete len:223 (-) Transcript_6624:39-707(-)
MPSAKPNYGNGNLRDSCQVRCVNSEGQQRLGEITKYPYAHDTTKTKGIVKRAPVFAHDPYLPFKLLENAFYDTSPSADYEKCSEATQKEWIDLLDRCDTEPVDYHDCEEYVTDLLQLCNLITFECTGATFADWGCAQEAQEELGKAWRHFVRTIWIRDYDWDNLVKYLSDPNREWSVDEAYYLTDPEKTVKLLVKEKLMVPLQVWNVILKAAGAGVTSAYQK